MNRRYILKSGVLAALAPFWPGRRLNANDCDYTTADIEGPFYTPNAPSKNKLAPDGADGTPLFITGTVYASDCETPMSNAFLDVWQAGDDGNYDNDGFNYRGAFHTDDMGNYAFESVLPGKYLNGDYYRPRHIHFKISGGNSDVLTTQLYFEGDSSIPIDPWASDENAEGRIIPLSEDNEGNLHGVFDVYLEGAITGVSDSVKEDNQQSNRIMNIYPVPVGDKANVTFHIGNNETKNVEFVLFNVVGKMVFSRQINSFQTGVNKLELNFVNNYGLKIPHGVYILQMRKDGALMDAKRLIVNN